MARKESALLEVEGLSVTFPSEEGDVHAVRDVSFTVDSGEVLGVVGESGSGKSVSLMAVPRLLPGSARVTGSVRFDGAELVGAKDDTLRALRGAEIAVIFQDPMSSMNPVHTVGRQIAEARRAHGGCRKAEARAATPSRARPGRYPAARGAREAVPARVLRRHAPARDDRHGDGQRPGLIIADEPTTALDVTVQAQVLEVLDQVRVESGASMVLVSHDLGVVAGTADRVQVMYGGTIVETGPTEEVFDRPRMPYTVGLLSSLPALDQIGGRLTRSPGRRRRWSGCRRVLVRAALPARRGRLPRRGAPAGDRHGRRRRGRRARHPLPALGVPRRRFHRRPVRPRRRGDGHRGHGGARMSSAQAGPPRPPPAAPVTVPCCRSAT